MNKKIYIITILAIIVTTLSQTVSFISGEHQFYQSVQDKCIKCHGDIKGQLSTSTNHSSSPCNYCHVKSAANHTNTNPACRDCHNTTQKLNDSLEAHTDFSSMSSKGCIACHTTYNALVNYSRAEYIDYTIMNSNGNWVISGVTTMGTLNLSYNAMRQGGDHNIKNVSCKDCHKDIFDAVSLGGHAVVLAKNSTNSTNGTQVPYHNDSNITLEAWCRTCHNRNDTNFSTQQHSVRKTTCEDCHQAYNLTPHPGNFFTNVKTAPHLYQSLICIACKSIGWPVPNGGIHFRVRQEPYFDVWYEIITPLTITNSTPANDPTTPIGTAQTFSITLNRPADIYWYNNGSEIFRALSVISSSYSSSSAGIGVYNITAVANDGYATVSRTWNWTVTNQTGNGTGGGGGSVPVGKIITGSATGSSGSNNISGYVFDNYVLALPGVLVHNGSYQNTTNISGYYSITNLSNGTYNFSYSKAGFDTGYSVFTLNGATVENVNVIIYDTTPPASVSNINTTAGNFYVNNSWVNPADADFNYTWFRYSNGTTLKNINKSINYLNLTTSPHYMQNISAQTVDTYGNINQTLVWFNATVPNNPPVQAPVGNKTVYEGQLLNFTVHATDADNDTITYGTNATKGTLNTTTGNFSWVPNYGDSGFYFWYFNSSDGYGGIANENVAVTVINVPLSITNSSPATDPTTIVGSSQAFSITLNRTANIIWYNNGSEAFRVLNVTSATYTNSTAGVGTYNITAFANDSYDSALRTWNWTVAPNVNGTNVSGGGDGGGGSGGSTNSVSGYVSDNFGLSLGGVLVQNGSYQNTTATSGYYSIANLSNGTYNFSYSRAGFSTAYFEFTLNGAVVMNANRTLYDIMPAAPVSNPAMTTGNFYVNNTWVNPADADFNYTWFRYSNGTTLQNVSKPVNYLNLTWQPHYTQNISAQTVDTSGNVNQTKVWFNITIPNNAPFQYAIGNKVVNENENLQFNVTATDADSDPITYGTNATKGTFNATTGNFSWTPGYGEAGFYFWNFNSSDGYGGIANENVAVTVISVPLSIISSSPVSDPTTIVGTTQTFGITLNRTANVTWYINSSVVQSNLSVVSANYTNSTAGIGGYNVTAIANDSYYSASRTWNWTVSPQPTYNVSGYVFDNYGSGLGGVLVQNGSYQNTTLASGYYLITGLLNGTYNFSYPKAGFNTGYLGITINGADNTTVNKTIYDTTPPASVSNSSAVTGNFYINNTWINPVDADFNYTWFRYSNGTTLQNVSKPANYLNLTWSPHYTQNISAHTADNYSNTNQTMVWFNATIPNNPPVQATIGNKTVYEGQWLNFTVNATDADNDTITYGTNATKGMLNTTTGNFSWTPGYGDAGFYFWNFNSSDGYGGIANENVAVTVINAPLSITSSSPAGDPTTTNGTAQTFGITLNRTANVTWYINNSVVQSNLSVVSANYTNSTAGIGVYNVTAIANDSYDSAIRTWNWTVIAQPAYNVSGYVFDNYGSGLGGVLVQNGSYQNTTLASGYYLITGLFNGTYNFSYSKAGFNTGYLGITINGADNITANTTIYDTTPPASVSNSSTATGNFYINNTWVNPADADFNYTWFRYSNGTTLQNVSKPANYLNLTWSPHYTQNISAQTVDNYSNINQTTIWFNATIPNNPPVQDTIGNKTVYEGQWLNFTINATDADNDTITYGTNATKGTFNATTGNFSWLTAYADAGVYFWYFNSSDGYGGVASETITVTVNNTPLSVTSFSPPSDPTTTQGTAQTFNITLNRTANVTWYVNGTQVQSNTSVNSASYTNSTVGAGMYNITAITSDGHDTTSKQWNWTVNATLPANYVPPNPVNLQNTTGNFWVNHTWQPGTSNVTNSYNASVNGTWYNGTINTFKNTATVPHGWVNITVWAYNSSGTGSLSAGSVSQNTQVPNNPPIQDPIGNMSVNEGQWLNFTAHATDADNDTITYGTNATKGSFNATTGNFSWLTTYADAGVYFWYFNSSDGYGGIANENVAVTVINVPLSITSASPATDPTTINGTAQTFEVTLNRTTNVTWYMNGSAVQANSSAASANYTNSTAGAGAYNVTVAATDGYDTVSKQWNWTVGPQPVYAPSITSWSNDKTNNNSLTFAINTSEAVNFNSTANQTITTWNWYKDGANQNNNYNNLTTSWNTSGTKSIQVNATNGNGTSNTVTWTVTVLAQPATYIPPSPANITSITGNFWVNTTWQPGAGNTTDSYNVSVNGAWTNGTTNAYVNSSLSAHVWQNVTVYAYNASGTGSLSASPATKNTQIPDNPPVQSPIGNKTVYEGQWLNFTVNATDLDNDTITYGTNATKGTFNATTGSFTWLTTYSDAGTYVWYFNSSDGYGGVASETITVTVNNTPLSVTSFSPPSDPTTTQGTAQIFSIVLNRTTNVTWYMNGTQVQTNTSVTSASYTNSTAGAGAWNVTASATDGIDTVPRTWNWTVNVQPPATYSPPNPTNLQNTTGNFWVNHTWQAGPGNTTDSYNISVNGTWYNGTINTFKNTTTAPHGWVNITVWAYNSSGTGTLSAGSISQNTRVPNNPPVQNLIGNKSVNEGQWLNFTVHATDADNDAITYGTNATKGTFNITTGNYSWLTNYGDAGVYVWYFNSSDGYGGVASETITVTVNGTPLSITNSSPVTDPATTVGTSQTFAVSLNRTANVTWHINGSVMQTNSSATSANYTNSTAGVGTYNVIAVANDSYYSASKQWNWTVNPQPVYAPGITSWSNGKTNNNSLTLAVNTSETVNFNATANQTITTWNWYKDSVNQNNNYDNLTTSWNTSGTKSIQVNATNSNGTSNTITWTVTVQAQPATYIPPSPANITSITGNFWVNTTWLAGAGNATDGYNVSVNGAWTNGTTNTYVNSPLSAHAWQNLTVYAFNASGAGSLSASPATKNTQIPNNPPVQSPIGNKSVNEGQWLNFTVNTTDLDNDTITYGTNAAKGTFNAATGNFSWLTTYSDAGTYTWYFNSSDGYGGVASETITVTVNNVPLSVTSFSPPSDPTTIQGTTQIFNVTLNRTANVIWYMNGTQVQTNTGVISAGYTNTTAGVGTWNVTASATDGIDTVPRTWNWTIDAQPPSTYIPPNPTNLQSTTGNFWINHTWQVGSGNTTNSYNVSVNGTWHNGTTNTYYNNTVGPHGWSNITVWAYNSSGAGSLSTGSVSQNTQVPNNPPAQNPIGNKNVTAGNLLTFTVSATDADNDTMTYGTNATKGALNATTGVYSWQTGSNDVGTYVWYFNSSDGYGGVAGEIITVTVNNTPLSIISSSPVSDPTTTVGASQTFGITLNRTANVSWYINGSTVQTNSSVISANYTNSTAGVGAYNITATASDGLESTSRIWNWTVISQPVYNVSGYVSGNNGSGLGGVLVQNGSYQSNTSASGYYLINGLLNGTYNFSYSKAGFNTGYLEVTINGADNTTANTTIYDTTPPASISNIAATSAPLYINWTWVDPPEPDFDHVAVYIDGTFMRNMTRGMQFYNASYFMPNSTHIISTRTVDTYGNVNTTWVNNTATTPPDYTYVSGFQNDTGTVSGFINALNASDGGASATFTEANVSGTYHLNITTNTTDIPDAGIHKLQLMYNASNDNFTLQIWNGTAWNNRTALNDTTLSYRNITLQPEELILQGISSGYAGSVNNYYVLVRYLDLDASPAQQGSLYLDYQRIYSE